MKDKTGGLTLLGSQKTEYKYEEPHFNMLETFPNVYEKATYFITLESDEFTSLCPKTGQPDYGKVKVMYTPKEMCIETKSFKLYLFAYRNYKSFMETMTNKILEDLFNACEPRYMEIKVTYASRGGITLTVSRNAQQQDKHIP